MGIFEIDNNAKDYLYNCKEYSSGEQTKNFYKIPIILGFRELKCLYINNLHIVQTIYFKKYDGVYYIHRDRDCPSVIRRDISGITHKMFFKKGKLHRNKRPAVIIDNVMIENYYYYKDGKLHREDGIASIETDYLHNGGSNKYYLEGKQVTKKDLKVYRRYKILKNIKTNVTNLQ